MLSKVNGTIEPCKNFFIKQRNSISVKALSKSKLWSAFPSTKILIILVETGAAKSLLGPETRWGILVVEAAANLTNQIPPPLGLSVVNQHLCCFKPLSNSLPLFLSLLDMHASGRRHPHTNTHPHSVTLTCAHTHTLLPSANNQTLEHFRNRQWCLLLLHQC